MIPHDVQLELVRTTTAIAGVASAWLVGLRARFRLRAREVELRAKLRAQDRAARATLLTEVARRFNQDVNHLQAITESLSTKLVSTAEKTAATQGKLELALPLLRHVVEMMPRFAGAVESMDRKLEAMNARLTARPIPGSGGKAAIEAPTKNKEEKPR